MSRKEHREEEIAGRTFLQKAAERRAMTGLYAAEASNETGGQSKIDMAPRRVAPHPSPKTPICLSAEQLPLPAGAVQQARC